MRGNERNKIFFSPRDYDKFREYIAEAKLRYGFNLYAYVLMTNHYHLLIETPNSNLHNIMQYLNSSYSTYTNTKRRRSGHLFQGRYKAIIVDKDSYLAELSRYIHLNPVRAKMVKKPEEYPHSSYCAYVDGVNDPILSKSHLLCTFTNEAIKAQMLYRRFVEDGLENELENPLSCAYGGAILGDEDFVNEVLSRIEAEQLEDEDITHRRALLGVTHVEAILSMLAEHFGETIDEIVRKGSNRRKICVYILKKYSDATNEQIREVLKAPSYASAAKVYQRFVKELESDPGLKQEIKALEQTLSFVQA